MKLNKFIASTTLAVMLGSAVVGCGQKTTFNNLQSLDNGSSVQISAAKRKSDNGKVIPGEFIVKFKDARSSKSILSSFGAKKVSEISRTGMQLIKVDESKAKTIFNSLKDNRYVEWVEPNRVITVDYIDAQPYRATRTDGADFPNDPMFSEQYAHQVSNSVEGWKISQGSADVTVAIVDTGVDGRHPEFKGKLVQGYDVYNKDNADSAYKDPQGHGTHCAGIAAATANNEIGVAGFAPNVKIQSVRVLDDNGYGSYAGVAEGMVWAAENGAKVMSMSLGGPSSSNAIEEAIKIALKNDVLPIAAMGNSGNEKPSYPAAVKGVMAVAATDSSDKRAYFSQYGSHNAISAPGVKILSTFPMEKSGMPGIEYGSISGTSMATPGVAGVAALVRSKFPNLKADQVRSKIEKSADDLGEAGWDKYYGHGRINVGKALQ